MLRHPESGEVVVVAEVIGTYDLVSVLCQPEQEWEDEGRWIQMLEGRDDLRRFERIA